MFGETDEMVNRKVKASLAAGLQPIMCVGETLEERQAGQTEEVLVRQTRAGLDGRACPTASSSRTSRCGRSAQGRRRRRQDAEEAIGLIRRRSPRCSGRRRPTTVRILYGGSVTPENIGEFMSSGGIDGALVGGASLKVDSFARIVEEAARVRAPALATRLSGLAGCAASLR